jgi:hypothetical protein
MGFDWENLLRNIKKHRCTPFIGAGVSAFKNEDGKPWLPLGSTIANEWAKKFDYPLEDAWHLAKVAQFVAIVSGDEMSPKLELGEKLEKINPPHFSDQKYANMPHSVLADLNLPIYITTNYDKFMEEALISRGRKPDSEYCRWNEALEFAGNSLFENPQYAGPTENKPLVYHLHGIIDEPQSMVLTERDYIDFVINLTIDENLIPTVIRKALAMTSLLFIGYSLEDINFRVIFQGIMSKIKSSFQFSSIAVQLPPTISPQKQGKALEYLDKYTKNMFKVNVYWIDASEFSRQLRKIIGKDN